MIFKKTLINFAMIQTVIIATSINVGIHLPTSDSLSACLFIFIISASVSLLPALFLSFAFAYASK